MQTDVTFLLPVIFRHVTTTAWQAHAFNAAILAIITAMYERQAVCDLSQSGVILQTLCGKHRRCHRHWSR
jgi:hypothetical protein